MNEKRRQLESTIYLCAPVNALVEGIYREKIPFSEIRKHGDFGLGTFNALDGEMVMIDGVIYQIDSSGEVNVIPDEAETPFACVTFYKPLCMDEIKEELDYSAFNNFLENMLPSTNIFYALRMEGEFAYVRTRSVPSQENYTPLVEVAKKQPTFEFENIEGTLAGFFTPSFMSSLNVPGLHLHFLSADRKHGGHLLECRPKNITVGIQFIYNLTLSMPKSLDYLTLDFQRNIKDDLDKAEK